MLREKKKKKRCLATSGTDLPLLRKQRCLGTMGRQTCWTSRSPCHRREPLPGLQSVGVFCRERGPDTSSG